MAGSGKERKASKKSLSKVNWYIYASILSNAWVLVHTTDSKNGRNLFISLDALHSKQPETIEDFKQALMQHGIFQSKITFKEPSTNSSSDKNFLEEKTKAF